MALALSHAVARPSLLSSFAPALTHFSNILRPSWSIPCEPSSSSSTSSFALPVQSAQTYQRPWISLIPSIQELLELFPPILLGTPPKKKISRARKGKGMVARWLKNKTSRFASLRT
jgi:large subunit ribosomal protein L32